MLCIAVLENFRKETKAEVVITIDRRLSSQRSKIHRLTSGLFNDFSNSSLWISFQNHRFIFYFCYSQKLDKKFGRFFSSRFEVSQTSLKGFKKSISYHYKIFLSFFLSFQFTDKAQCYKRVIFLSHCFFLTRMRNYYWINI